MLLISAELSSSALFRLVAALGLVVPIAARTPPPAAYLHGQVLRSQATPAVTADKFEELVRATRPSEWTYSSARTQRLFCFKSASGSIASIKTRIGLMPLRRTIPSSWAITRADRLAFLYRFQSKYTR